MTENAPEPIESGRLDQANAGDGTDRGGDLLSWFLAVLAPVINRDVDRFSQGVWCSTWWAHPEAVARVSALYEAWRVLVDDDDAPPEGASNWWLHSIDPHLSVLLDKDTGPFSRCTHQHKDERVTGLASEPVPSGGLRIPAVAGPGPRG